jgi:peptidoglycan/LPS O-acetylase OafA/YrhL
LKPDRIAVLDAFRAIAIFLVIGFHYLSRWTPPRSEVNLYPYGGWLSDFPLFRFGGMGVQLFFIVSGFVISMTLLSCRDWREFAWKRFARLFPAMLLCSAITFFVIHALPAAPFTANPRDFLPGLTFTDPELWQRAFGVRFGDVDGVYWSLQVEVKFYFWACLLHFLGSPGGFPRRFLLFLNATLALVALNAYLHAPILASITDTVLLARHLPWFAAGVGFHAVYRGQRDLAGPLLILESGALLAVGSVAAGELPELLFTACFFALFAVLVLRGHWLDWLAARPLVAVGAASYSLYLLHDRIGVTALALWTRAQGGEELRVSVLLAVAVAATMALASMAVFRYWEVPSRRWVLQRMSGWRERRGDSR